MKIRSSSFDVIDSIVALLPVNLDTSSPFLKKMNEGNDITAGLTLMATLLFDDVSTEQNLIFP